MDSSSKTHTMINIDHCISTRNSDIHCRHLTPALNVRAARVKYTIATLFHGHGCMDDLRTEHNFDSQATWVIAVLGLFLDMLSIGVGIRTTRHWQTSSRLVQELSVCNISCTTLYVRLMCSPGFSVLYSRTRRPRSMVSSSSMMRREWDGNRPRISALHSQKEGPKTSR